MTFPTTTGTQLYIFLQQEIILINSNLNEGNVLGEMSGWGDLLEGICPGDMSYTLTLPNLLTQTFAALIASSLD